MVARHRLFGFLFLCFASVDSVQALGGELLPAEREIPDVIDAYVGQKLAAVNVSPASVADDANLVRRTTLDLVGRIPTVAEAKAVLAQAGLHVRPVG